MLEQKTTITFLQFGATLRTVRGAALLLQQKRSVVLCSSLLPTSGYKYIFHFILPQFQICTHLALLSMFIRSLGPLAFDMLQNGKPSH